MSFSAAGAAASQGSVASLKKGIICSIPHAQAHRRLRMPRGIVEIWFHDFRVIGHHSGRDVFLLLQIHFPSFSQIHADLYRYVGALSGLKCLQIMNACVNKSTFRSR